MAGQDDVLRALVRAIEESSQLDASVQSELTLSTVELDAGGEHSNVTTPIVEFIGRDEARRRPTNTDLVGFTTDSQGRRNGRVYEAIFRTEIECNTITSQVDPFDGREISYDVARTLRPYTDQIGAKQFTDIDTDDDNVGGSIQRFQILSRDPQHDFGMSPSMRRWQQLFEVVYTDSIVVDREPMESVELLDGIDQTDGDQLIGSSDDSS
jgi:hypothetical protein